MSWPDAIFACVLVICLTSVIHRGFEIEFQDDDKEGQ